MKGAGWSVEVDRATPAEWAAMLELFNDANIYQTWAYGAVHWQEKELSHLVLKMDGEVSGIAQLRIVRPAMLTYGIAYLRWGPLFERRGTTPDPNIAHKIARALEEEYVTKRKLFLRILPNAFVGSPRAEAMSLAFSRFTEEAVTPDDTYRTLVLDLVPGLDELRRKFDKKWRNRLSLAERNNLKVIVGTGAAQYEAFCTIYGQMRRRKGFESSVNIDEFRRIQASLPPSHKMQILLCEDRGELVAALIASAMGDSAIYILGATSDAGLRSQGAYLLHWTMIRRLKDQGIRWYDLGGIDPIGNPGVYSFKCGLSGNESTHMDSLIASGSIISSALVKAGLALRRTFGRPSSTRSAQSNA